MRPYWNGADGWSWGAALLTMVIMGLVVAGVIVAIIYAIVYAVRGASRMGGSDVPPGVGEDRALATLRERYARGEIDHAEYEERRERLLRDASARR